MVEPNLLATLVVRLQRFLGQLIDIRWRRLWRFALARGGSNAGNQLVQQLALWLAVFFERK